MSNEPTSLTQEKLQETSAVDKHNTITSFINSQTRYINAHALEGKKAAADWGGDIEARPDSGKQTASAEPRANPKNDKPSLGFSSPILKPRVPIKAVSHNEETQRHKRTIKDTNDKVGRNPKVTQKKTQCPGSRKRKAGCASDDEHAKRMEERTERRRVKKAIVAPKEVSEDDEEKIEPKKHAKGIKGKLKESDKNKASTTKKKIPAGLALMHGFNASNIGKQRLTVNNKFSNSGVFSKGKASKKSKVENRKYGTSKSRFNESNFLGSFLASAKAKRRESSIEDTASVQSDFNESSVKSVKSRKRFYITNKPISTKTKDRCVGQDKPKSSSSSISVVKSNYESEVWDIELDVEGSIKENCKISQAASASIVVNCKSLSWGKNLDHDTVLNTRDEPGREPKSPTGSSTTQSSVTPSQSASQLPIKIASLDSGMISRFFGDDSLRNLDSGQQTQQNFHPQMDATLNLPLKPNRRDGMVDQATSSSSKQDITPPPADEVHPNIAAEAGSQSTVIEPDEERDALELLEDLNHGIFLNDEVEDVDTMSVGWDYEGDLSWATGSNPKPEQSIPVDFLGAFDVDSTAQYTVNYAPDDGEVYGVLDYLHHSDDDPILYQDCYVDANESPFLKASDVPEPGVFELQAEGCFEAQISSEPRYGIKELMLNDREFFDKSGGNHDEASFVDDCSDPITSDEGNNSVEPFFSQGRALLLGMEPGLDGREVVRSNDNSYGSILDVEKNVARSLRDHWHAVRL